MREFSKQPILEEFGFLTLVLRSGFATGGSAQTRGFATGVGSKADIGEPITRDISDDGAGLSPPARSSSLGPVHLPRQVGLSLGHSHHGAQSRAGQGLFYLLGNGLAPAPAQRARICRSTARMLMIQAVVLKIGTSLVAPVADARVNCRIMFHHDEPRALRSSPAAREKPRYKTGQPSPLH